MNQFKPQVRRSFEVRPTSRRPFFAVGLFTVLLVLLLTGCASLSTLPPLPLASTAVQSVALPPRVPPPLTTPTSPVVPTPPTPAPAIQPTPATPTDLWLSAADVEVFPQPVYAGDLVSFRVTLHNGSQQSLDRVPVGMYLGDAQNGSQPLSSPEQSGHLAAGGETQVTFQWVWNTAGLTGPQTVSVVANPDGRITSGDEDPHDNLAVLSVTVLPASARPPTEANAHWDSAQNHCCVINFITGSAADRDLDGLLSQADASVSYVEGLLGVTLDRPLRIYVINRVLGQGGFASGWILISYLDRDYAAGSLEQVLRHEATHALERRWAGRGEPLLMMSEGLAVWVAGGHLKPEPLTDRAAALLALGRYKPLAELAPDFYDQQHDISYLEVGAFVKYLADHYGIDRLRQLYGSFEPRPGSSDADTLDRALRSVYGRSLADMESDWLAELRQIQPDPRQERDLSLTIDYYDTVRRYQQVLDPSAYFRQPWLPDVTEAQRRGIVADFLRHPRTPANATLEAMLIAAHDGLLAGQFDRSEQLLGAVNTVLAAGVRFDNPLAARYRAIVDVAAAAGYQVERVWLDGDNATVLADRPDGSRWLLQLTRTLSGWRIVERA
jgi:hypothetical protein